MDLVSSNEIAISVIFLLGIIFFIFTRFFLSFLRKKKFFSKEENFSPQFLDFTINSQEYNFKEINLYGEVVYIFSNSIYQIIKRKLKNYYCLITHSNDYKNRYIHLRFLISNPRLKKSERILIEYNLSKSKKLKLRKGDIVEIKGEYIHPQYESKHFYGKIHKVHSPDGYVKKITLNR